MNQMGNLEKLGILVIVILVVVVGVVAITPKEQVDVALFPDQGPASAEPLERPGETPAEGTPTDVVGGPKEWPLGTQAGDLPAVKPDTAGGSQTTPPVVVGPPTTVGGAPAVTPPVAPEPQFTEYVVQKNDTGEAIARKTLGRAGAWAEIVAANPGLDARRMKIGQKLRIPAKAQAGTPTALVPPTLQPVGTQPAGSGALPVAPAIAPPVTPAPAAAEKTYTVQSGDTLSDIARRELGSASRWRQILEANSDVLHGSEVVRVGMKLRIPARAASASTAAAPAGAGAAPSAGAKTYKVQSGDTLTSIASRTLGSGARWREILRANESVLHGSERLSVGMELTIPDDVSAR